MVILPVLSPASYTGFLGVLGDSEVVPGGHENTARFSRSSPVNSGEEKEAGRHTPQSVVSFYSGTLIYAEASMDLRFFSS